MFIWNISRLKWHIISVTVSWTEDEAACRAEMVHVYDYWTLHLYSRHLADALFQCDGHWGSRNKLSIMLKDSAIRVMSSTFGLKDDLPRPLWVTQFYDTIEKVGIRIEVKGDFSWWVCSPCSDFWVISPLYLPACPYLRPLCLLCPPGIRLITKPTLILPRTL